MYFKFILSDLWDYEAIKCSKTWFPWQLALAYCRTLPSWLPDRKWMLRCHVCVLYKYTFLRCQIGWLCWQALISRPERAWLGLFGGVTARGYIETTREIAAAIAPLPRKVEACRGNRRGNYRGNVKITGAIAAATETELKCKPSAQNAPVVALLYAHPVLKLCSSRAYDETLYQPATLIGFKFNPLCTVFNVVSWRMRLWCTMRACRSKLFADV